MATKQPCVPASEPDEADSGRAQRPDCYGLPARKTRRNDKWTLVAKPRKAIHIYETGHGFRLNDRKLFNCLLYYAEVSMAWEKGAFAGTPVFVASNQDLRRDIGLHQKASNSQLAASMERLQQQEQILSPIREETSGKE